MSPSQPESEPIRPTRGNRGQALTEFAVLLPLLLFALMGVVEFGNALSVVHAMTGYSREGANIAARGTSLDTVVAVLQAQGAEIELDSNGGTIATKLTVQGGLPIVEDQVASLGWSGKSRLGLPDSTATRLNGLGLIEGQSYWVVEVFFNYQAIGPLSEVFEALTPETLYRWSLF